MKKALTYGAMGILTLLLITSVFNIHNGFDLFMSKTVIHDVARVVLIATLLVTLVVHRPRSKVLRSLFVIVSVGITIYAVSSAANYTLELFDTMAYILAAVILMTESLEMEEARSAKPLTANQPTL